MCNTLIDPPYELVPSEVERLEIKALQLQHAVSLICTDTPFANVDSQLLLLLLEGERLQLHAYAPTYNTLIDPPYKFAPLAKFPRVVTDALESSEEVF
jgi:hypothetical protein